METEKLERFEKLLTESCDAAIAAGNEIVACVFISTYGNDRQLCPIGAVCFLNSVKSEIYPMNPSKDLSRILGFEISRDEAWSFIDAFDGVETSKVNDQELFDLGKKFRDKYITGK